MYYEYKYVAVIDPDEVIVPLLDEDWPGLLRQTEYLTKRLQVTDCPSVFLFKHTYVRYNGHTGVRVLLQRCKMSIVS